MKTTEKYELFRMQDKDGRGPFKPGFSHVWLDDIGDGLDRLPPIYIELNIEPHRLVEFIPDGMFGGCACVSEDSLKQWFSRKERRRLKLLGYKIVSFFPDLIIATTPTQVLFANYLPLSNLN